MTNSEICFAPAKLLTGMIRDREVSVHEIMEAHLARIEKVNPKVNAIRTISGCSNWLTRSSRPPASISNGRPSEPISSSSSHVQVLLEIPVPVRTAGFDLDCHLLARSFCDDVREPIDGFLEIHLPPVARELFCYFLFRSATQYQTRRRPS